jgi:glycosyltransferase involved in cell wall biosynthesis
MTDRPRILMLAPQCFPLYSPEAIVSAKLALAAVQAGWHVDVLSGPHSRAGFQSNGESSFWAPVLRGVVYAPGWLKGSRVLQRLTDLIAVRRTGWMVPGGGWAAWAVNVGSRLLARKRHNVILSRYWPATLAGLVLSRRTGVPWVANWNDPWPGAMNPRPSTKPSDPPTGERGLLRLPLNRLLSVLGNEASWHTFPCERLRRYIRSYIPADISAKSSVIPHIAIETLRATGPRRVNREFTLCHAGTLRGARKADVFLNGVSRFVRRVGSGARIGITFIGVHLQDVFGVARRVGVENLVSVRPLEPYEQALQTMYASDVLVCIEGAYEEGIYLPSKIIEYVQAGRPILAVSPSVGTVADILSEHGGGIAVDCRSPDAVAEAIAAMYAEWKRGSLDVTYGSRHLFGLFSEELVLGRYVELFRRIGAGKRQNV